MILGLAYEVKDTLQPSPSLSVHRKVIEAHDLNTQSDGAQGHCFLCKSQYLYWLVVRAK